MAYRTNFLNPRQQPEAADDYLLKLMIFASRSDFKKTVLTITSLAAGVFATLSGHSPGIAILGPVALYLASTAKKPHNVIWQSLSIGLNFTLSSSLLLKTPLGISGKEELTFAALNLATTFAYANSLKTGKKSSHIA